MYDVYTNIDDNQTYLTSIDGSIATTHNIDSLKFKSQAYNFYISGDSLLFEINESSQRVYIYYYNVQGDNTQAILTVTNEGNDSTVLSYTATNPNEFNTYFSYAGMNVTNSTVFKAVLVKTNAGGETTIKQYFNLLGHTALFSNGFALTIAFLLLIFGFSFVANKYAFGFFGIFVSLGSIVILSMAIGAWYITFMITLSIVLLVYCVITLVISTYPTAVQ